MPTFGPTVPARDAMIENANPTFNYGARNIVEATRYNPGDSRTVAAWNVSGVPTGVVVGTASIAAVIQQNTLSGATGFGVFPVIPNEFHFAEGTGTGSATGDGVTWNAIYSGTNWTTPGGDYDAAFKSAFSATSGLTTITIDVKTALQKALDSYRDINNLIALLLKRDSESGSSAFFRLWSKQADTPANAWTLTFDYTVPGGMLRRNGGLFVA